ncbi:MAG: DUF11 domain-containing protein, partial [Actinobacteria bacterium]|nr:DUF11 domain-containing protein [Actinomycetota bacterium]
TRKEFTPPAELKVVKTAATPDGKDVDDSINYTITVENTGNVTVDSIVLTDTLTDLDGGSLTLTSGPTFKKTEKGGSAGPNNSNAGTLVPGEVATYEASFTITQAVIDAGGVSNTAIAKGKDPSDNDVSDDSDNGDETADDDGDNDPTKDPTKTPIDPAPSQTLEKEVTSKTGTAGTYALGDVVTYTITHTNTGNVTLNSVLIKDLKLTASTASGQTGSCAAVAPGATCVLVGTYTIQQADKDAGTFTNTASVTSTEIPTPLEDDNTIILQANENPTLSKALTSNADEDSSNSITVGDTLTYTVTLLNDGDVTLTDTVVSDDKITPSSKSCATVAVNATCVLVGTYSVTQA